MIEAEPTTGIRNPRNPGVWLVPPVAAGADVHAVVRHFSRFRPALHACAEIQSAYYQGFAVVLAAIPSAELLDAVTWRWYQSLLTSVGRCAESSEAEYQAILRKARHSMQSTLVRTLGVNGDPMVDPQEHEDGHVKQVKEKSGAK
ncbi:MAG TPA: hypothetical protein VHX38_11790 [Pseudonocardiaceae bacterium]|nr:hypothetical protein [Pseudonocardiaceae bacterium]